MADPTRRPALARIHKPDPPFTIIPNSIAQDASLSWKARGILALLWSLPEGWTVRRDWLVEQAADGRDSLKTGLREIREAGLLSIANLHDEAGRFLGREWTLHEPSDGKPVGRQAHPLIKTKNRKIPPNPAPPTGARSNGSAPPPYPTAFEAWWTAYPRRPHDSKKDACRCWRKRTVESSEQKLREAAEAYAAYVEAERTEPRYIMRAATFLGPNERWIPFWEERDEYRREPGVEYGGDF
jgi:hypothetical protein